VVALIHDDTVTGAGDVIWTSDFNVLWMRILVTNPGSADPLDLTPPSRYLRIGWWALLENFVSDPFWPDGISLIKPAFIDALFEKVVVDPIITTGGVDGFHYDLQSGVEVQFVAYSP